MFTLKSTNWNDYPTRFKRGAAIIKVEEHMMAKDFKFKNDGKTYPIDPEQIITRRAWKAVETPIFSQDRNFILDVLDTSNAVDTVRKKKLKAIPADKNLEKK
jgi:hypothetical protein